MYEYVPIDDGDETTANNYAHCCPPSTNQWTHVDNSSKYPAARVPSESLYYLLVIVVVLYQVSQRSVQAKG